MSCWNGGFPMTGRKAVKGGVVSALAAVLACVGLCVPSAVASDGVDWRVDGMGVRLSRAGGRGRVVQAGDRGRPALLSGNR